MRFSLKHRETLWFYLLISPFVIGLVAFTAGPMLASLYYSFTHYDIVSPAQWVGLENFAGLIDDEFFWKSLKVTTLYTLMSVPLGLVFSLCIALLLNQRLPGLRCACRPCVRGHARHVTNAKQQSALACPRPGCGRSAGPTFRFSLAQRAWL